MKENQLREILYVFALKIIAIYKVLQKGPGKMVLSRPLLRPGTSISDVTKEVDMVSRDFLSKISTAY